MQILNTNPAPDDGVAIPTWVIDSTIDPTVKSVYFYMLAVQPREEFPVKYLARSLKKSPQKIMQCLRNLENLGLIKRHEVQLGQTSRFDVLAPAEPTKEFTENV